MVFTLIEIAHWYHKHMMLFQKKNKIKAECVSNTQFLLEHVKLYAQAHNIPFTLKAKTVMAFYINKKQQPVSTIHIVVQIDENRILDPSYEFYRIKDVQYFESLKPYMSFMKQHSVIDKELKHRFRYAIKQFLDFKNTYEEMPILCDSIFNQPYYDKQLDFLNKNTKTKTKIIEIKS
jgi:hypothetical protein